MVIVAVFAQTVNGSYPAKRALLSSDDMKKVEGSFNLSFSQRAYMVYEEDHIPEYNLFVFYQYKEEVAAMALLHYFNDQAHKSTAVVIFDLGSPEGSAGFVKEFERLSPGWHLHNSSIGHGVPCLASNVSALFGDSEDMGNGKTILFSASRFAVFVETEDNEVVFPNGWIEAVALAQYEKLLPSA